MTDEDLKEEFGRIDDKTEFPAMEFNLIANNAQSTASKHTVVDFPAMDRTTVTGIDNMPTHNKEFHHGNMAHEDDGSLKKNEAHRSVKKRKTWCDEAFSIPVHIND